MTFTSKEKAFCVLENARTRSSKSAHNEFPRKFEIATGKQIWTPKIVSHFTCRTSVKFCKTGYKTFNCYFYPIISLEFFNSVTSIQMYCRNFTTRCLFKFVCPRHAVSQVFIFQLWTFSMHFFAQTLMTNVSADGDVIVKFDVDQHQISFLFLLLLRVNVNCVILSSF